jgi:carboxyl-terminal processing protease
VREGVRKPIEISIKRDIIKVVSVRSKMLEPGFGYVRIAQFQNKTGEEFRKAVSKLQKEQTDLKGLVLDLRNNPGGILQASVEVVDSILNGGLVVYTEGRVNQVEAKYSAAENDMTDGTPIVVLINGGSASASEIVAGALQDHHRAVIMGTDSFGKGSVQTVVPLSEKRAIKLTTARYFTPSGRSIQAQGIVPDITVKRAKIEALPQSERFKEADLRGHLSNGNSEKNTAKNASGDNELFNRDNQLYEALNLLKGLHVLSLNEQANNETKAL